MLSSIFTSIFTSFSGVIQNPASRFSFSVNQTTKELLGSFTCRAKDGTTKWLSWRADWITRWVLAKEGKHAFDAFDEEENCPIVTPEVQFLWRCFFEGGEG